MKSRISGTVKLTSNQKKMIKAEADKVFKERMLSDTTNLDAAMLLILHEKFGFGTKRLKQFFCEVVNTCNKLMDDFQDDNAGELAKIKLRNATGIDVEKLYKELNLYV